MTIHGPHIFFEVKAWALAEKITRASFVVCISHYCKSQLMLESHPDMWRKLRVVHCGINTDQYRCLPNAERPTTILFVGRLAAEKGLRILFASIANLARQNYSVKLQLIGDGPDRDSLQALAMQLKIDHLIEFSGFKSQEEIRSALHKSAIFVLPSFAEGVPVSLMEAMACGVPVIATNVGGVSELVQHESTGLLVAPSDAEGIVNAIIKYLDEPGFAAQVSARARQLVELQFNSSVELEKLEQLFRQNTSAQAGHG